MVFFFAMTLLLSSGLAAPGKASTDSTSMVRVGRRRKQAVDVEKHGDLESALDGLDVKPLQV